MQENKNGHIILLGTDVHVAAAIASSSSTPPLQSNDSSCSHSPLSCESKSCHNSRATLPGRISSQPAPILRAWGGGCCSSKLLRPRPIPECGCSTAGSGSPCIPDVALLRLLPRLLPGLSLLPPLLAIL
uniref:Uncharacterized protein n=1 Tax=Triticum urartu TaxID=4572 RepID=A0A8R7QCG6_TRIUA